jgi:hypothetical protein
MHTVVKGAAFGRQRRHRLNGPCRVNGRLVRIGFPANVATAAQIAIPVSDDFVMIVPSFVAQRRKGGAASKQPLSC